MRLPQSSNLVFLRPWLIVSLIALVAVSAVHVRAATLQLNSSTDGIVFGTVTLGQTQTEEVVLTNNGTTSVIISSASVSSAEFKVSGISLPLTLPAGAHTTFHVAFAPTEAGWIHGRVVFTSDASNRTLLLAVEGDGVKTQIVQATPASHAFGNVAVGETVTIPVTLTNERSTTEEVTSIRSYGAGFSAGNISLPARIAPGKSLTIEVSFAPTRAGVAAGSILLEGLWINIPLTGTGTTSSVGTLSIAPGTVSFGKVAVGASATETSTLSATGGSVIISSASSSNAQFAIAGVSFPLTLAAGQSAPVKLIFTPMTAASSSSTLTFVSNASDSSLGEAVSGTGTTPYVTLSWSPSASDVSGYNVYRGTAKGSYAKINAGLDASTNYTDSAVVPGTTYYYAATAVSATGMESGYSTPVEITIP